MKFEDYDNFYQHVILGYINELREYATIMFLLEKNTDNIIYRDEQIHKLESGREDTG